jgi:predicted nuclease with RNAse H fold
MTTMFPRTCFLGLDVQSSKGCPFVVLDSQLNSVDSGWIEGPSRAEKCSNFLEEIERISSRLACSLAIGIDSPRQPLPASRPFYWNRKRKKWRARRGDEAGYGRHCEVVVSVLKLANPQWTPLRGQCPQWMMLGFDLFTALQGRTEVFEVFPTATYSVLQGNTELKVRIDLAHFSHGPKDMLDACAAALTVREFTAGRGCEVGGGDRLGTIILPADLTEKQWKCPVHNWP